MTTESSGVRAIDRTFARWVSEHSPAKSKHTPWVPVVALVATLAGWAGNMAWNGGIAERTLADIAKGQQAIAASVRGLHSESREARAAMGSLAAAVEDLKDDNQRMALQLAELRGSQSSQALLVVELQRDSVHAKEERSRFANAVATLEYNVGNLKTNMQTARRELDWIRHGKKIPPPTEKEDGQ